MEMIVVGRLVFCDVAHLLICQLLRYKCKSSSMVKLLAWVDEFSQIFNLEVIVILMAPPLPKPIIEQLNPEEVLSGDFDNMP